mmetsp:Transcript_12267/g.33480  ORF Transcript_12267/g.33480 Transcript_12267/m.33480 type:complete len:207 (-) Transcript_12267:2775-3395(-)
MAMMRVSRTAGRVVTPTRCTCAHPYSPCAVRAMMSVSPSPLKSAAISGMTGGCGSHSVDSGRPCSETTTAAEAPAARTVVGGPCVWRDRGMSVGAEAAGPSWCHASSRVSCMVCWQGGDNRTDVIHGAERKRRGCWALMAPCQRQGLLHTRTQRLMREERMGFMSGQNKEKMLFTGQSMSANTAGPSWCAPAAEVPFRSVQAQGGK